MKPRVAVHKFSSCDGCQLAFLNMGEPLLQLAQLVDIVHFAEAGMLDEEAEVDIAFIEGSVSTHHDLDRIQKARANAKFLVTIGACATAGGLQALRDMADADAWIQGVYARPSDVDYLKTSKPISKCVKVDLELWGCPINGRQLLAAVRSLLSGVMPVEETDKICLECKRNQNVCVMVTKGVPCMGPVTKTGCAALCPEFGRDCYACYGPAENINTDSFSQRIEGLGLSKEDVARRFLFINNGAQAFRDAGLAARGKRDE